MDTLVLLGYVLVGWFAVSFALAAVWAGLCMTHDAIARRRTAKAMSVNAPDFVPTAWSRDEHGRFEPRHRGPGRPAR